MCGQVSQQAVGHQRLSMGEDSVDVLCFESKLFVLRVANDDLVFVPADEESRKDLAFVRFDQPCGKLWVNRALRIEQVFQDLILA